MTNNQKRRNQKAVTAFAKAMSEASPLDWASMILSALQELETMPEARDDPRTLATAKALIVESIKFDYQLAWLKPFFDKPL